LSTVSLPGDPSLEKLRKLARRLQRSVRAGEQEALAIVAEHHPGAAPEPFPLSAAQLVIARRHGFTSWPALRHHLETIERYRWTPDEPHGEREEGEADRLCRLACLCYQDDSPERRARARALLAQRPELSAEHIWAAATACDVDAVRGLLAGDPTLATRRGGPYDWCPLFYLAYSRLDPDVASEPVMAIARTLLDAGADPNEGYLWRGLPTPFTLLTGAFGHGELGPANQPAHPHSIALARLLLDAGADANDGQALYNRMFEPDNDHLELLLEYGLGGGHGGPWKIRLGDALASPREMLRGQFEWALAHDQLERIRLLVEHGIDISVPDDDGHTPAEVAALCGNTAIVEYLLAHGAPAPALAGASGLLAAIMAGDPATARAFSPDAVAELRAKPWLIVWAAARGRIAAVRLLLELGFDVNAFGRGDIPGEQRWQSALHTAAGAGHLDIVRLLLAAGADPNLRDNRFGGTALGWAEYGGHGDIAALLAPLTQAAGESLAQPDE
jgi:ankyrin repeat protein